MNPDEEKSVLLELLDGQIEQTVIIDRIVIDSYSSSWSGGAEKPWRVHCDDVKQSTSELLLGFSKSIEVKFKNVYR